MRNPLSFGRSLHSIGPNSLLSCCVNNQKPLFSVLACHALLPTSTGISNTCNRVTLQFHTYSMTVHIALSDVEPTLGQNESEPWRSLQHIRGAIAGYRLIHKTHISAVSINPFSGSCPHSHHMSPLRKLAHQVIISCPPPEKAKCRQAISFERRPCRVP